MAASLRKSAGDRFPQAKGETESLSLSGTQTKSKEIKNFMYY